ncbi:hypothetical protein GCM10011516_29560 [Sphingobacterium cellulitidis]|uniref:Uncharacterized protein n=1 Tax=Sphingobacterium cellulitidis TaxID=1768011 RepID=A0A8H9G1T0_9SPHI|nr:hypothetical protein CHT99_04440 [Sphingobacterium cellulitidis]GGE29847.1 hypothetical protein GCM10011516_29560 [Sphingobacterium soli]
MVAPEYRYYFQKRSAFDSKDNLKEISDDTGIIGTFSDYFSIVPYTWLAGHKNSVFKSPYEIFPHYVLPLL